MGADARASMQVEQEEEEVETEVAMELRMPTQELAMSVAITPTPTPDHTYSINVRALTPISNLTTVSSLLSIPATIYSTVLTSFPILSPLLPLCDAIIDTRRYAHGQDTHPTLLTRQATLVQATMRAQFPISSSMVRAPLRINVHLDSADLHFLKKKAEECKDKQKNPLLSQGKRILY